MNKERGGEETQVVLAFSSHTKTEAKYLKPFFSRMETVLEEDPTCEGVIFEEERAMSKPLTKIVEVYTAYGIPESAVRGGFMFTAKNGRVPNSEELLEEKQQWFDGLGEFQQETVRINDRLIEIFPKRVRLVSEWTPEKEVWSVERGKYSHLYEDLRKSKRFALEGKLDEALPYYKRSVLCLAERGRLRHRRIVDSIKEIIQSETPPVLIMGHLGSAHTQVYHLLKREGVDVTAVFPEKEEVAASVYLYPAHTATARKKLFFPERRISHTEWMQSLILFTIEDLLIQSNDALSPEKRISSQEITAGAWLYKEFFQTRKDVQLFKEQAKELGFLEALFRLYPETEEQDDSVSQDGVLED